MNIYHHPTILINLDQAQELVDNRDNGSFSNREGLHPIGEWYLEELEGLVVKRYHAENRPVHYRPRAVAEEMARDGYRKFLMQPSAMIAGISCNKGGRAWLEDVEWSTEDLEALCLAIREHVKRTSAEAPSGAVEAIAYEQYLAATINGGDSLFAMVEYRAMLNAGINPQVHPRIWDKFHHHRVKGWSAPRIVCAANQYSMVDDTGTPQLVVIPGPRHMSTTMGQLVRMLGLGGSNKDPELLQNWRAEDQGFIDQHDNYYTRAEAWVIARFHNQMIREGEGWPFGLLFSEHLY